MSNERVNIIENTNLMRNSTAVSSKTILSDTSEKFSPAQSFASTFEALRVMIHERLSEVAWNRCVR